MVASLRQVGGRRSELEQRYYLSSREMTPEEMAKAIRAHWAVENKLHWMLDVNFGEDACTVKKPLDYSCRFKAKRATAEFFAGSLVR